MDIFILDYKNNSAYYDMVYKSTDGGVNFTHLTKVVFALQMTFYF